ncbi:hypothetical protein [Methyloceanibacter caenitepidi]|uniref:Mlr8016 protein n=1 Tax=Methyloceanibacter caenitepidi TaxID=1384459 RepID=A0A0A8K722_9HYPH|nr:hypothetical protein [Methyloceanibacter caenitepidi]BAQ18307.1 Mlr8016 protein [Methyloceanibacter caenitepidi]
MADLYPVAGSKIYIGGVKARQSTDFVAGDFAGESWAEIDGWSQCGAVGDVAELITEQLINTSRDVKQKGTSNAGSMQNVFVKVASDPGQAAFLAAAAPANKSNYAFKIEWASGETWYFIALAMTSQRAGGGANTIDKINATVELNSNIVEDAA